MENGFYLARTHAKVGYVVKMIWKVKLSMVRYRFA